MTENSGHRKRLRERFSKSGFSGFHDYEVLEFLLTFIIPRRDVKLIAKELIKKFGSFSKVLDAPVSELEGVEGMGSVSALSFSAFRNVMTYYFQDSAVSGKNRITKMTDLIQMLRAQIGNKDNEVLFGVFFNAKNEVLAAKALGEGTVSEASAFPRKIVEEALRMRATSLILAHNHPGGVAEPSDQDVMITKEISKALSLVDVGLQDHVILAANDYYSFKRNNLL